MKLIIRLMLILFTVFAINKTAYAYTEYKIGDIVSYNGINYYVIKNSGASESTVTLLKATPLTVAEVNTYGGVGTANNHVNMYSALSGDSYYRTAYNNNGYGGMAYYRSPTCGYNGTDWVYDECKTDYAQSEVRYVVDAWKEEKAPAASEARLIQYDELIENLGYDHASWNASYWQVNPEYTPSWVYNSNYWYWTMSQYEDSPSRVWTVRNDGGLGSSNVSGSPDYVVRPVITLSKTSLGDTDESITNDNNDDIVDKDDKNKSNISKEKINNTDKQNNINADKKETITKVKVENTYKSQTLIIMIIGFISICSGVVIYYLIKNKVISRR